jgi:hypothetical protein
MRPMAKLNSLKVMTNQLLNEALGQIGQFKEVMTDQLLNEAYGQIEQFKGHDEPVIEWGLWPNWTV